MSGRCWNSSVRWNHAAVTGISKLSVAFDREISEERMKIYVESLEGCDEESIANGVNTVIRQGGAFLPTPGQLRSACLEPVRAPVSRQLGPRHACTRCGNGPHEGACESVPLPAEAESMIAKLGIRMRLPS